MTRIGAADHPNPSSLCVCCSGKLASTCCLVFLQGQKVANTPEELMRSRFSAYAWGGYGEYLFKTWSPRTRPNLSAEQLSLREQDWQLLEVVKASQTGDQGQVEFKAYYLDHSRNLLLHHEKSIFERVDGAWLYTLAT